MLVSLGTLLRWPAVCTSSLCGKEPASLWVTAESCRPPATAIQQEVLWIAAVMLVALSGRVLAVQVGVTSTGRPTLVLRVVCRVLLPLAPMRLASLLGCSACWANHCGWRRGPCQSIQGYSLHQTRARASQHGSGTQALKACLQLYCICFWVSVCTRSLQALKVKDVNRDKPVMRCITDGCSGFITQLAVFEGPLGHEGFKNILFPPPPVCMC